MPPMTTYEMHRRWQRSFRGRTTAATLLSESVWICILAGSCDACTTDRTLGYIADYWVSQTKVLLTHSSNTLQCHGACQRTPFETCLQDSRRLAAAVVRAHTVQDTQTVRESRLQNEGRTMLSAR